MRIEGSPLMRMSEKQLEKKVEGRKWLRRKLAVPFFFGLVYAVGMAAGAPHKY